MSQLKKNIIANFMGKGWATLISLVFVPFYIRHLGIEAYGLIGFFATLQVLFSLLDMGLSTTLNREIAQISLQSGKEQESRDLVRTLEIIYWIMAAGIALLAILFSPLISTHWIKPQSLSISSVQQAVLMIGLATAFQFPFALYSGGLLGLQQQVYLNCIIIGASTLRGLGAVLILCLVSSTVEAFFCWQIFISAFQTVLALLLLWKEMPTSSISPKFQKVLLFRIWRFAAEMTGIGILSIFLLQTDKIILSKLLSLEKFGYYSLAFAVASGLYAIGTPVYTAVFPRLSQLVALKNETMIVTLYHNSCQFMHALILPVAVVIALFAPEILLVWTRDPFVAKQTHLLLSLLCIGATLHVIMNVPYALQIAQGWTKISLWLNLINAILLIPSLYLAAKHYDAIGAATVWIIINMGNMLVGIELMHKKFIQKEKKSWYFKDVGFPLSGALIITLPMRWVFPQQLSLFLTLIYILSVLLLSLVVTFLITPFTRNSLLLFIRQKNTLF